MSVTKVAIAGMTDKFAKLITGHLLSKPNVEINGFCRDPSKVPQEISSNPRIKVNKASSTDTEQIRQAIKGTDICICCYLGDESLMEEGQKQLIDTCIEERVPRFMDSGYTFDYRPLELGAAPQKDFCKKVRAYLEQKQDQLQAVHILNGAFMEVCFAPFYGLLSDGPTVQYWGDGDEKLEMTTYMILRSSLLKSPWTSRPSTIRVCLGIESLPKKSPLLLRTHMTFVWNSNDSDR